MSSARGHTPTPCRCARGQTRRARDCGIFCLINATIEIDGLRKRFGSTRALDGMTFTVRPGQVTGLVDAGALQRGRSARNHLLWLAHSQGIEASRVDKVIALALIAAASGDRVALRTTAPAGAMTVLAGAGAEVTVTGSGVLTISGLSPERAVATLTSHAIPFSEVTAHRATLEQAYTQLTGESVEYRAEGTS